MYDVLKRHAVHVLQEAGMSQRKIGRQLALSRATVCRILEEPPVAEVPELRRNRSDVGRPPAARAYEEAVRRVLESEPDLPGVEILHRVRQLGYGGGKSALYELVARVRPVHVTPMVRFEGLAGEFSQHDFGQVRVRYLNGQTEVVRFFASRLKWSRWAHVVTVPDEGVESLVRSLLLGLESFGGVPLVAVFDNPKTVVLSRQEERIEWNPTFGQVALDFRFAPELCTPGLANQKGSVENLVGWVKNSFFRVRRFHDREDLEQQRGEWLDEVNLRRPSRATGVAPAVRIEEERRRFRPLAFQPAEYALRYPVFVGPTGWIEFKGVRYSMPPQAIHMPATLFLYPDRVVIATQRHRVEHPRKPPNGRVSTHPEHSAAGLAQVSGRRAKLYFQRQRLLELGASTESFLTELVHARPRVWMHDVERLFEMLQRFGPVDLVSAIQRAYAKKLYGAEYVRDLLVQAEVTS